VRPLFDAFASNVFYLGASGRGTIAKLVNNLIFLAGALVVQEGFVLAAKAGSARASCCRSSTRARRSSTPAWRR
jgi:3-hydroxyisobutyrate dehydrogenase-like beta-hydroxyacid dehydrogenase